MGVPYVRSKLSPRGWSAQAKGSSGEAQELGTPPPSSDLAGGGGLGWTWSCHTDNTGDVDPVLVAGRTRKLAL